MSTFIIADATNNITISQDGVIIETIAKEAVVLQIVLSGEALNKSNVDELWIQHDGKYSTEIPYTSATVVSDTPSSVEDFRQKVLVLLNANGFYSGGGGLASPIEITRATAITMNAANGGNGSFVDGQLYRITNPANPFTSVVLRAQEDQGGNPRLSPTGIGNIATTIGFTDVECGYDPLTNTISYIYEPVNNVHLSGTSPYSTFPFRDSNYHDVEFVDLTLSLNDYTLCQLTHTYGIGCTIILTNSKINGCEFGHGSSFTMSGTEIAESYLTNSRVLSGSTHSYLYDTKISKCQLGRNFSVDYVSSSQTFIAIDCWLENFEIELAAGLSTWENCVFGGNYQYLITRDFNDVDFSQGFILLEGRVYQDGGGAPTVTLLKNDFNAIQGTHTYDGAGEYTLVFDLQNGKFPLALSNAEIQNTVMSISASPNFIIGLAAIEITDQDGIVKITTSVPTSDSSGSALPIFLQVLMVY